MNPWALLGGGLLALELLRNSKSTCPPATQNIKLNIRNRNAAIKASWIQYGPMNLADTAFWKRLAKFWNTTPAVAQQSRCANCVAFDISPRMDECMPGPVSDGDGRLGYCWVNHFKCHSARTCRAWAAGGPITTDYISKEWRARGQDE